MKNAKFTESEGLFTPVDKTSKAGPVTLFKGNRLFSYDSDDNILVTGSSGKGKTESVVIPFCSNCISHKESLVVLDHGGEIYKATGKLAMKEHDVKVLDFSSLRNSPDTWNPFKEAVNLRAGADKDDTDHANEIIDNYAKTIYLDDENREMFWTYCARDVFTGIAEILMLFAKPEEINIESVIDSFNAVTATLGAGSFCKDLCNTLMPNEKCRVAVSKLSGFANAPRETANSMLSTATEGINKLVVNTALSEFLSNDSIDIASLSDRRPTAIYIIVPRATNAYNDLVSLLFGSIVNKYIRNSRRALLRPSQNQKQLCDRQYPHRRQVDHQTPRVPSGTQEQYPFYGRLLF